MNIERGAAGVAENLECTDIDWMAVRITGANSKLSLSNSTIRDDGSTLLETLEMYSVGILAERVYLPL